MTTLPAHDPYRALREPGFRRYLTGNLIGTFGSQMQGVAVGWELYERTHSALALGLVATARTTHDVVPDATALQASLRSAGLNAAAQRQDGRSVLLVW